MKTGRTGLRFLAAITLGLLLTGVLVFARAPFYKSSSTPTEGYSTDINELRGKFNRDKGKVRLLLLLSPT